MATELESLRQGQPLRLPPRPDLDLRHETRADPIAGEVGEELLLIQRVSHCAAESWWGHVHARGLVRCFNCLKCAQAFPSWLGKWSFRLPWYCETQQFLEQFLRTIHHQNLEQ